MGWEQKWKNTLPQAHLIPPTCLGSYSQTERYYGEKQVHIHTSTKCLHKFQDLISCLKYYWFGKCFLVTKLTFYHKQCPTLCQDKHYNCWPLFQLQYIFQYICGVQAFLNFNTLI